MAQAVPYRTPENEQDSHDVKLALKQNLPFHHWVLERSCAFLLVAVHILFVSIFAPWWLVLYFQTTDVHDGDDKRATSETKATGPGPWWASLYISTWIFVLVLWVLYWSNWKLHVEPRTSWWRWVIWHGCNAISLCCWLDALLPVAVAPEAYAVGRRVVHIIATVVLEVFVVDHIRRMC